MPIPTPQFFGVDIDELSREQADGTTVAYRSACVFAKKIVEKRRKIKSCFERVISPSPPPPPPAGGVESAQYAVEQEETRRVNGDSSIYANGAPDEAQMLADEIRGGVSETRALIAQLGNANPVLRELLSQSINEMESSIVRVSDGSVDPSEYYGRRLMQRQNEYAKYMNDVLVDHPIMTKYGKEGLPGIDLQGCEALCEGISVSPNQTDASECRALAFKRRDPRSGTDFTGRCFLLQVRTHRHCPEPAHCRTLTDCFVSHKQNAGTCKVEDFASELYTRQIDSENICHDAVSEYDNPLCIQLPTTRTDSVRCRSNTPLSLQT